MASKIIRPIRGPAGVPKPVANKHASAIDANETMASAVVFGPDGRPAAWPHYGLNVPTTLLPRATALTILETRP